MTQDITKKLPMGKFSLDAGETIHSSLDKQNKTAPDQGITFRHEKEAILYASKHHNSIVTPIMHYPNDQFRIIAEENKATGKVHYRYELKENAKKIAAAWLVDTCTHRPEERPTNIIPMYA